MRKIFLLLTLSLLISCNNSQLEVQQSSDSEIDNSLPRAEAEELPCDVTQFDQVFRDVWGLACNELHGLMVVKDGKVIYEKYDTGHHAEELHVMWSVSKTFTATAVGFACQEGLMSVDDKVLDYFEAEAPVNPSILLKEMTVKDLLIMSSGFQDDYIGRSFSDMTFDWAAETLMSPLMYKPGSMYSYNSMNTYLLSVIVSRVTGKTVAEYLNRKLFTPLGIDEFIWESSPQGYSAGGWGLYITLESMAKMGQFFLNRGTWNGQRLLNESWFDEAMKPQIMQWQGHMNQWEAAEVYKYDEWNQGYGYQMWVCTHGAVRLDGAWGQYVIIVPEKNLVVACQAHNGDGARFIQSVWRNIYDLL